MLKLKCKKCQIEKDIKLFTKSNRTKLGFLYSCKECNAEYAREFAKQNPKSEEQKEKDKLYKRAKRANPKKNLKINERRRFKYKTDPKTREKKILSAEKWRKNNREKLKETSRKYCKKNRDIINEKARLWWNKNSHIQNLKRKIQRQDISFEEYLSENIFNNNRANKYRVTYNNYLIQQKFSDKIYRYLKLTPLEFKEYLESSFDFWMSWDNYGKFGNDFFMGWDIDHIKPLSYFNLEEEEERIKAFHYTNLQPLCSYINRVIKKDNYPFNLMYSLIT